jgi:predicted outer membrane repeat protein
MRVAFEKSRKATLNPRRRLQLRSAPSTARQKVQRRVAIEQLEDRTLLTTLIINQLTAGLGLTLNNAVIDADSDGVSDFDSIIFEDLTIDASSGNGVSIDLDNLTFNEPFTILFDNVSINGAAGAGIDIELSNLLVDTIAIDSSTISGDVGNAFNVDLTNVELNEFNVIDSTIAGQLGAGMNVALSASIIKESSIRRSTIDGVAFDVTNGSVLLHTTMADSQVSGNTGNDGFSLNLVDSIAEELRLTNNNAIQGVSINVDDTLAGGAALLTELYIHSNTISDNQVGDGIRIDLNNVDLFASITGNSILDNNGHGIVFDQVDGDLSGDISDNLIGNNSGHGIFFTPSTTNPIPTGDGAPGVPPFAGTPGATDKIDFAAPRNEVQLITFAGQASGGFFQLQYTDNQGLQSTTLDIAHTATAAQVKAALVAMGSDITVDDILVNGNFEDGYEIEFVNDLAGQNMNSLEVVNSTLTFLPPSVFLAQDTSGNQSEVQTILFSSVPTFGTYTLFFLGQSTTLAYNATDVDIQNALIGLAANAGYPAADIVVTNNGLEFEIAIIDDHSNSLAYIDIDEVIPNADGLNFNITITEQRAGSNSVNEQQLLEIMSPNNPAGQQFFLTFGGTDTGLITIGPDNATTIANIDFALEAAGFGGTGNEFTVSGSLANGFVIEFTGDLELADQPLLQATWPPGITITPNTTTPGDGQNEIQQIFFPAQPGGGDFTLTLDTETTGPLAFDATALEVQTALEALSNIGFGNVSVTKTFFGSAFVYQIEFVGTNSLRPADFVANPTGTLLTIDPSNLIAAVPTVTTVSEGTSLNEVQEVVINGAPTGGFFTLTFDGETTGTIAYSANAASIITELELLGGINPGEVLVRGDAVNGFEIEFVGTLATIDVPQITADASGLTGGINPSITTKTTSVGGYLRGIRGNTIVSNLGAGIEVDLAMYTSFYGDVAGNTISGNQTQGISLNASDPTPLISVDFSLSVDGNTMDANRGAAVTVNMEDTATGDVSITNNTITGTVDDGNLATPYTGDAIYIDLYGTDVSFEAYNQLRDLTIEGNYLGTDSATTAGLGNAGNGVGIHIEESTIIDRTQISNNVIANNTGDGVFFHREDDARVGRAIVDPIVGEERAVMIYSNTITGNSNGVDILAQNGTLTTTDFEIRENILSSNVIDGIKLHAEADATIFVDIINNQLTQNSRNGIESTTRSTSYDGTDRRDVAGTWIQNNISNNADHGVEISGRIGNRNMLFIGLDGVDPITGIDRGNVIESNGRDGIQVAALLDPIDGNIKIANNSIQYNQTGGVELLGKNLNSSIDNNDISNNNGKGIDINSNHQTSFIRGNTIAGNASDGLEILSANLITHTEDGVVRGRSYTEPHTSVTVIGNFIDNNGGRGVDLQTEQSANSDFIFGDGTIAGANEIYSNALEGFYVVTTASTGQDQDADSTTTLDATGNVTTSDADMVLQINTNFIQDNGGSSNFSSTGLVLRIGTMASEYDFSGQTPNIFSRVSVGDESGGFSDGDSNGRSNVSVTGNFFEGNFGEDVYIESFTSTVDPPTTTDNWDINANPAFRVQSSYRRDPLAKLNLVFEENTGNGLNVVNFGAYYDNAEPVFKSRLANGTPAPNPDGPFNSATRRRNAQRVASRAGWAPTGAPNDGPDIAAVLGASIDPVSGRILIQSDDVSAFDPVYQTFFGYTVQITPFSSGRASDSPQNNPAYGVFEITDIDYNANTFTLISTEGADLTGFTTTGAWSTTENNGSFVYDGTGVSTFRVADGWQNNNFQGGDNFFSQIIILGNRPGEQDFAWDTWVPDSNTFLTPFVGTFLTADISVAVPDPTNVTTLGDFTISFTEDVFFDPTDAGFGVSLSDFSLFHDNAAVSLAGATLSQIDARTYTLNIDGILGVEGDGEYELRLNADGTIFDAKYIDTYNPMQFGDVERFTIDSDPPTAMIEPVSLTPINRAAGEVIVNFSKDVNGVDLSDFSIAFTPAGGGATTTTNLASTPATLTQVTGSQFVLDLSKVTSLSGDYELTLTAAGSSITDLAGNALAANAIDMWVNDTLAPIPAFDNVTDPVDPLTLPGLSVFLEFSDSDLAVTPAISDFTLTHPDGSVETLTALTASINDLSTASVARFEIVLDMLVIENGLYTVTFNGEGSAVEDLSGNKVSGSASETFQVGDEIIAPTAGIQDITPDPRDSFSAVGDVTINFSEDVTGVDATDFKLFRDDGTTVTDVDLTGLMVIQVNDSTYRINLGAYTALDGEYTLQLLADGTIEDTAFNKFTAGASDSWRTGGTGPEAMIEDLPATLVTNAGVVTVNFSQSVTGVDITDFQLTLNGQDIPLTGLTVIPVSGNEYAIDLSSVTQAYGTYELSLIAAGSNIRNASNDPILDDASESWINSSTIDLVSSPVFTDGVDSVFGDGIVGDLSGTPDTQTLRAAIQEANALAGSNIIELAAGTYTLSIGGIDEDQSATGDLDIRDNLTIRGQGVGVTTIDAGMLDRIFQVFAGITLNLENLTITGGNLTGSADGAGIRNSGTTTLTNVEVTGNIAADSAGGINNSGLMIIVDSTISNNEAGGSGGGIRNTGTLEVTRSTISGNITGRDGGGLFNAGAGTATLSNATFSGNEAARDGGAIRNTATVAATNNTMTLNSAISSGGAISNSGAFTLQNNLIIDNIAAVDVEVEGSYISLGSNLTGLIGGATGFGATDILNVIDPTPVLDSTLADNGGPTLTHALLLGSIAIDAGINTNTDALEQRGSTRILGTNVDIGAIEFGAFFVNSNLDTVDVNPGDGVAADVDGNITLRAAIMEANALAGDSVIILGPGTFNLTIAGAAESAALTGDLDITDLTGSLTITGAGSGQTIIDATDLGDRVFDVLSGANLTLDGVTVTGGYTELESGGGIRNIGTLALVNSVVDNNTSDLNAGGILNGLLSQQGILSLTNSVVSNNSAVDGGGIFNNDQSQLTLVDSEVIGNTATNDGGGIFNDLQATIDLLRSSISNNVATLDGGGIYNNDLSSLTINDSKVNGNTANQGAGIFNEEAASLTVARTTVSGNKATLDGGGIYNDEGVVTLDDVSILTNTADNDGGGLYNASAGSVTITNGYFDDNSADRDGGAIANFGVSLSLDATIIRDSEALRNGGGLFNDQEEGTVTLLLTSLINNEAQNGGGIYNQELGSLNLEFSDVMSNIATMNGGGIFNTADGALTLQGSTVDGNVSTLNGAGIYNEDNAQLNVLNSTVSNNVASNLGGGIYNNSIMVADIVNATISGNEASSGGGIYNSDEGSMEITNATIFNNHADIAGGVLNVSGGSISVSNTIIAGNSSDSAGPDVNGMFNSLGTNLIGESIGNGFTDGVNGDLVGTIGNAVSPGLGALQDNGGATFTHELLGGSLARDAGNNFYAPTDDQRGFARLFDGDGDGSLVVDIGAFESGYIVTGFTDSVDANPGDGVSVDENGRSTLRAAVMEANARIGADTILLGTGVYTLSLFGLGENNSLLGDLDITDDLTIIGAGAGRTVIDADFLDRIFHIFSGVNVSIRGVTLVNGNVTSVEDGGAILNFGNLSLEDVEIRNSVANRGGAVFNVGVLNVTDSELLQNTAIADGGAIYNIDSGTVTVDLSTISGNDAENGGGIFNSTGGTLEVTGTTIDGNTATVAGGGVFISNEVAVGNGEGGSGGAVPNPSSSLESQYQGEVVVAETYEVETSPRYDNGDAEAASSIEAPPFLVADTFNLSSLPGSNFTIYLDFNGHTTTGTQWNTDFGQVSIVTPAYDTDGNVGSFSLAEIEDIQRAWLRVAEDFAPFNVNVTTAEPPVSDLIRTDASDTRWGVRVVSGVDTFDLGGTGGLAYLTSFNASTDTPAFVFNAGLIGVAETISHEVGHTLGLSHDGTSILEYYPGHGTGATSWAPIMGAGFLPEGLVQWSSGEYTDADNSEDDLTIITTQNGFGYRIDDHGNGTGAASIITGGMASGIVERNTDVDYFQFTTTGGDVLIDPFYDSANLDILAILYDSSGTQIQTSNPVGALNASFTGLGAGTYYVSIDGTGEGSVSGTGYSDYGSLGQYTITVSGQPEMVVPGSVSISDSTISKNFAGTRGGGLLNEDSISLSNVTISGNEAGKEGGAIHNTGELTVNNTTVYNNSTEGTGGGIYSVANTSSVNIKNTIVAGNNALVGASDVAGDFTSQGNNLIGTQGGSVGFVDGFNSDIVGTDAQRLDPALSALDDNGGPTLTHALKAGSLAIDAGDNTDGDATDQRGALRPTDTTSDIGAFEIVKPTISIDGVSQVETNMGETTVFEFIVSLSNVNVDEVSVDFETSNLADIASDLIAIAGIDYEFTTGTITFSPGETTQIIEVIVNGDVEIENHEMFSVNLFNAVGADIGVDSAVGEILNDDAEIYFESDVTRDEGPQGTTTEFNFTVRLRYPVADTVTVDYQIVDGTAELIDNDYNAVPAGTLTFIPGETEKTVTVVVNGDSAIEPDETFTMELSNQSANAVISDPMATGTIKNDDFALLSISDVTLTEDYDMGATTRFTFTVSLSQAAGQVVKAYVSTADGSATIADGDYSAVSMMLIEFAANETVQTFDVIVNTDLASKMEGNETFFVNILDDSTYGPTNANILDGQGVGTIVEHGIVVDTLDDVVDSGDGLTSLREAITLANNTAGVDNIILLPPATPGGTNVYEIADRSGSDMNEDGNLRGDFDITDDVNIFGQGTTSTIINADPNDPDIYDLDGGNGVDRIFHVMGGAIVNLSNMELVNGNADDGGALLSEGDVTIHKLSFRNNDASFTGGAISSAGTLDISDSQFLNNNTSSIGGAIYQYQDTVTVSRSTFTDNTSGGRGGAVYIDKLATFNVSQSLFNDNTSGTRGGAIFNFGDTFSTNTTFSGNHSNSLGGAIFNAGDLQVQNNTITQNTASTTGGGISSQSVEGSTPTVTLVNTIVAENGSDLGNPDLDGAYDTDSSLNNLIGNIGSATGLTDGVNDNIVGSALAPIDPLLGGLLNNGGPTKTHSLLTGSQAIDAGTDAGINGMITAADEDQIGNPRIDSGVMLVDIGAVEQIAPPMPPLIGTGGDSSAVEDQTNIQITVVKEQTAVSADGHTLVLPANEDWIHEWDSFWVEVWIDTASGFGISDVLTSIAYNTAYFTATSVEFGSNFTFNRTVELDDAAGVVRNLGGSTFGANVGGTGHALFARIKFESLEGDQVEVDSNDLVIDPLQLGLDVQDTQIEIVGVGAVTANVGALPETDLYPVIYDVDDNDVINTRDLIHFVSVYNQDVYTSSSVYTSIMDFDKSGRVDVRDLRELISNYGKRKSQNPQVSFPDSFGQKWVGTSLDVVSGDDSIEQVIEAAVDTWETALGLDEPLEVEVIVRDFGTAQLGSGQTTEYNADHIPVAGRVAIDDDANGLGWHVDVTDLPAGGGYDLYTVLLHEIGHVLGFTRYYSGFGSLVETGGTGDLTFVGSDFTVALDPTGLHTDDPALPDDLMNDTLDPGVRKTPSDISVQMLLEAYASAQGGSGSGGASPIYGTNSSDSVAEPVLLQSPEAAQTFVEESTVGFVAPAAIKSSEEDGGVLGQTSTFDVIQPLVIEQPAVAGESDLDVTIFEDLYSSKSFEDNLSDADVDDRQLVFAHADDELDLTVDFEADQELMDDAFTNWERQRVHTRP